MKNKIKTAPNGFSTVSPHLLVGSIEKEIEFLEKVFGAEIVDSFQRPNGKLLHATVKIGDTTFMIGPASPEFPATTSMNYIFVENADTTYRRALTHGATSVMEPEDQFFGHRQGAIKDPQGNIWWVAKFLRRVSQEELSKKFSEQGAM